MRSNKTPLSSLKAISFYVLIEKTLAYNAIIRKEPHISSIK